MQLRIQYINVEQSKRKKHIAIALQSLLHALKSLSEKCIPGRHKKRLVSRHDPECLHNVTTT